jgi:prepilin-type N-terminal cleavage/methylation domain-containing protein
MLSVSFHYHFCRSRLVRPADGFSLVEVLVAAVIIGVSALAATTAFNVIVQSIGGTGLTADQNRRIDAQIAVINELSEIYTACKSPSGVIPENPQTECEGGIIPRTSYYYFPDYQNTANVDAFFTACRSSQPGTHITNGFVEAINALQSPGGGVSSPVAERVQGNIASNHLIEITWSRAPGVGSLRQIRLAPVVSAWCP